MNIVESGFQMIVVERLFQKQMGLIINLIHDLLFMNELFHFYDIF